MLALAAVAFATGAIVGANRAATPASSLASSFVAAWARGDYTGMYLDVDPVTRSRVSPAEFVSAYRKALRTATATASSVAGRARNLPGGVVEVPVRVRTELFGVLHLAFRLRFSEGQGRTRIAWSRSLAFPGLRTGERLARNLALPPRAALLARDRSVLAEGSPDSAGQRSSPLGGAASAVLGDVAPPEGGRRLALEAQGVPPDAIVGAGGLERALDARLRGTPGGELLAERVGAPGAARVLATAAAHTSAPVRTTISPPLQRAAVTALGGHYGGVVAMKPGTGEILAVAGIGLDSVQPPGSTFKLVTLTGVLAARLANRHSVFPYATYSTLDGVKLSNANGESCGGTLELAFAVSCNSVFAPLGVKLGAKRLVETAERFGFNHEPGIEGAAESTLPRAGEIQGELDLGSSAIGQGRVQASALQMAITAATVADGGRRPRPTFAPQANPAPAASVMSSSVAHAVRRLMVAVVREGTGTSAAVPGVVVAGKTGTAELQSACSGSEAGAPERGASEAAESGAAPCRGSDSDPANTDAWFAAFAPALKPRIVVAVLLVKDGAGGDTAAPVAREVLEAGLGEAR